MDPSGAHSRFETRLKVKALGALFAAGATLVLITIALPHAAAMNEAGLLAVCVNAYLISGLMIRFADHFPDKSLPALLGWGSVLVTAVAHFSGERPSPLVFFYLWVFLYAAYFFSRKQTSVQVALVGILFGALLWLDTPASAMAAWWIVGMGALIVAAGLVIVMRSRVDSLIERLHEAARTDPLTGLRNRQGLREALDLEIERCRRGDTTMALLLAEIDHFNDVSDQLGHARGTAALQRVARVLSADQRRIDGCARMGREEFALILPDTGERGALRFAERMRGLIAQEFTGERLPLSLSFGIATFPGFAETASSLLRTADEALRLAKLGGGNQAVVHDPDVAIDLPDDAPAKEVDAERYLATMLELAEAVDIRFSGSARHCETVGRYAAIMATALGLPQQRIDRVRLAGVLHDIGKIGVPDAILGKPSALTDAEWQVMKGHAGLGAQFLEHPSLEDVQAWVGAHHERVDGRGYPNALEGDDLPIEARILSVADAYEAMTSDRSYRISLSREEAFGELRNCAGSQFDAEVVEAFIGALDSDRRQAPPLNQPAPTPVPASASLSPVRV